MDVSRITSRLAEIRERLHHAAPEPAANDTEALAVLQRELGTQLPRSASEAFMMAAALSYLLELEPNGADCRLEVASSLTEGLIAFARLELGAIGQAAGEPREPR